MDKIDGTAKPCATLELPQGDMQHLQSRLSLLLEGANANTVYKTMGANALTDILAETSPGVFSELNSARSMLENSPGYVVIRGTQLEELEPQLAQLTSIALSSVFGKPTRTDRRKAQIAWPIEFDPNAGKSPTFSQTMGEAEYHTDTQYFERPERYFGLFCMVADIPGRGTNRLIDGRELRGQIQSTAPELIDMLRQDYPFRVPPVFTKTGKDDEVEILWAPILPEDGSVRYRRDTIEKAIEVKGIQISSEQAEAIQEFDKLMQKIEPTEYHLEPGEAVFVNNHHLLHARTPYNNHRRLLYRVRMEDLHEAE